MGVASDDGFEEVLQRALVSGDLTELSRLPRSRPRLARSYGTVSSDPARRTTSIGEILGLRFDPTSQVWRTVAGTGEVARLLLEAGAPVEGRPGDR